MSKGSKGGKSSVGGILMLAFVGIWFAYDYESLKGAIGYVLAHIIDLVLTLIDAIRASLEGSEPPKGAGK